MRSVFLLDWRELPTLTGQYALAWVVGFLSFLTPSGLGVREGTLAYLLSHHLSPVTATLVALLARIWFLLGELTLVLGISMVRWLVPQLRSPRLNPNS